MSQMIKTGKELLRISPKNPSQIEYSTNDGRNWVVRHPGNSAYGSFEDLTLNGSEILAATSKGLFVSKNGGRNGGRGISGGLPGPRKGDLGN